MKTKGLILGTFMTILSGCSHVKPTIMPTEASAQIANATRKAIPADPRLEQVTMAGRACRDAFEKCTNPESVCKANMNACSDRVIAYFNL